MKRKGLGRGLDAIINVSDDIEKVEEISLDKIIANPFQPRQDFDEEALEELRASIEEHGVLQPIIVVKKDKGYEIVAGERRYRAARLAQLKKIPALVRQYDDEQRAKLALVENIQREDLNPVEESRALKTLIDSYKMTQEELGKVIGKSRSYVTNALRLLNLPEEVLEALQQGNISMGHARALLSLESPMKQKMMLELIVTKQLSVREVENLVSRKKKPKKPYEKDVHLRQKEEDLARSLGRKVTIRKNAIVLAYHGQEDLERLLEILE